MKKKDFVNFFINYGHLGMYMKVIKSGFIEKGDNIKLIRRNKDTMTIYEISKLIFDKKDNVEKMKKALQIDCLSEEIKTRFNTRLVKLGHYETL